MYKNAVFQRFTQLSNGMTGINAFKFYENLSPVFRYRILGRTFYKYQFITALTFFHDITIHGINYRLLNTIGYKHIPLTLLRCADPGTGHKPLLRRKTFSSQQFISRFICRHTKCHHFSNNFSFNLLMLSSTQSDTPSR